MCGIMHVCPSRRGSSRVPARPLPTCSPTVLPSHEWTGCGPQGTDGIMKLTSHPAVTAGLRPASPSSLPTFDFHPLTRVVYGPGTLARLGDLVRELGGTRLFLAPAPGIAPAGHPRRAAETLRTAGVETFVFDGVEENPTTRHVQTGLDFARRHATDFIVAVGGGSSMDCAKGVNFLLTNGGKMGDYKGFGKASKPMLPSIGVPTTARPPHP